MHNMSRSAGLCTGAYNATTHVLAAVFRGKVPGKGTGKGRDREKGRVMEGVEREEEKGWRGG